MSNQSAQTQLLIVSPIFPGRVEAWRRFIQEMTDGQNSAHNASRIRMHIRAERIWINESVDGAIAVMMIETDQPEHVLQALATSQQPFDRWFRQQVFALLGHDLSLSTFRLSPDLIADWQQAL